MTSDGDKFYLLLGEADRETVTAKLKINGIYYKKKRLESSLANWDTIFDILNDPHLVGVIAKISNPTLGYIFSENYRDYTDRLLSAIADKPHAVFVHESFYTNRQGEVELAEDDPMTDWYHHFGSVDDATRAGMIALFDKYNIDVRAYRTNVEFSVESSEFIENRDRNVLFRMYVANNRMWSDEARKVIALFKDYLSRICKISIQEEQFSTAGGTVYELAADGEFQSDQLPVKFADFTALIDASATDVAKATKMLVAQSVPPAIAEDIVRRYAKEAKRLVVDIRQERERKLLDVRHRMESELTDAVDGEEEWRAINTLVEQTMPDIYSISGTLGVQSLPAPVPDRPIQIINPQIIGAVHGFVAQAVNGDQNFGPDAESLLRLVQSYGGIRAGALMSDVYELEDKDTPPDKKTSAKGRLMAFIGSIAGKIGDGATSIATAYIQSKLGL